MSSEWQWALLEVLVHLKRFGKILQWQKRGLFGRFWRKIWIGNFHNSISNIGSRESCCQLTVQISAQNRLFITMPAKYPPKKDSFSLFYPGLGKGRRHHVCKLVYVHVTLHVTSAWFRHCKILTFLLHYSSRGPLLPLIRAPCTNFKSQETPDQVKNMFRGPKMIMNGFWKIHTNITGKLFQKLFHNEKVMMLIADEDSTNHFVASTEFVGNCSNLIALELYSSKASKQSQTLLFKHRPALAWAMSLPRQAYL